MGDRDVVDAAEEYAQHIPVRVIANMLGLPEEDADRFRGFVHHVLEGVDPPARGAGRRADADLFEYLQAHIVDHVRPTPATTSSPSCSTRRSTARSSTRSRSARTIGLLLIAGIDTTWSAIGASIWHLAGTPADRERLVAEPELLPTAIEELLRAYAPVTMARLVKEDMDFNGCPMKADDFVLLPFPAANRDPEAFDRADEVIIDREVNRHAAFGLGIHRCAGSHLARMEMRVALEEWLAAFPDLPPRRPRRRPLVGRPGPRAPHPPDPHRRLSPCAPQPPTSSASTSRSSPSATAATSWPRSRNAGGLRRARRGGAQSRAARHRPHLDRGRGEGQALRRRPARAGEVRGHRGGRPRPVAADATCCPTSTRRSSTTCSTATTCRPRPTTTPRGGASAGMRVDPKSMAPLLDVLFAHDPSWSPPRSARRRPTSSSGPTAPASRSPPSPVRSSTRRKHAAAGADLIVAQGTEAGGHTGLIATMVLVPEVVDAVGPDAGARRGRHRPRPPARGRHGARRRRRVVRLGVAHHRGGRDPAGGEGEVPARRPGRHRPLPVDDRQAGPDAAHRVDRRVGADRRPRAAADADPAAARRPRRCAASTGVAATDGSGANDLDTYFVGQVVGTDEHGEARPAGWCSR